MWPHKLRPAMVRPERELQSGVVELDQSFEGGRSHNKLQEAAISAVPATTPTDGQHETNEPGAERGALSKSGPGVGQSSRCV